MKQATKIVLIEIIIMTLTIILIFSIPPSHEGIHNFLYIFRFAIFLFLIFFGIFYTGLKQKPIFLLANVFLCIVYFIAPYIVQTLIMCFDTGMRIY